jgi:HD-GYP domain-containing protein (c-di-GMP phosphodiesterase class II)
VALQHHERIDGSGYPNCLKGDQIAVHSKIAAVADVFDAITSHRVYHRGRTAREALMIIYASRNTEYDMDAVLALVKLVGVYPVGTRVSLDSGEQGVVVAPNLEDSTRPVVEIDADQGGRSVAPYQLSLRGGSARIVGLAPARP